MEEKQKSNSAVLGLVIFMLILIIAGLVVYIALNGNMKNETKVNENNTNTNTNSNTGNLGNTEIGEEKENNKVDIKNLISESTISKHVVPQIEIKNSQNVDRINREIIDLYASNLNTDYRFEYGCYINDNILSLAITIHFPANNSTGYEVYNVDINTGDTVSNESIMTKIGMSEGEYLNKLKIAMGNKFEEMFGHGVQDDWYNSILQKTIATDNYSTNNRMFLNGDKTLCVIAKIYSMAGPEAYNRIVEVK